MYTSFIGDACLILQQTDPVLASIRLAPLYNIKLMIIPNFNFTSVTGQLHSNSLMTGDQMVILLSYVGDAAQLAKHLSFNTLPSTYLLY